MNYIKHDNTYCTEPCVVTRRNVHKMDYSNRLYFKVWQIA